MTVRRAILPLLLFLLALAMRSVGLYRGLEDGTSFHPDVAKQIQATQNYLEGNYLWYTGSPAYDGYPYGLNHVDEAAIRLVWPLYRAAATHLHPGQPLPAQPNRVHVHYACLSLRVLYGMLAWLLFGWTLRRVGVPAGWRQAWMFLAALAPLSSTVTHFATGDVGTDLFVMAALALFAESRRTTPPGWNYAACGLALGAAFACKYQGILGILAPGLFLLMAPIAWRVRFRLGVSLAAGVVAGFASLTPHLFIRFKQTGEDILLNFRYIQRFGADPAFFDRPLGERCWISLASNLPVVASALGVTLLLLGLLVLIGTLARWMRQRDHHTAWDAALISMPFAVLLLALTGKPELQPFHFSLLALPLLLGPAIIGYESGPRLRGLLMVAMLLLGAEYTVRQRTEWTFWSREDTQTVARRMERGLLEPLPEPGHRSTVATLAVEKPSMAVFRNKPMPVRLEDADAWRKAPHQAVPATPWSFSEDWVFADLPAFPRESRLLVVEPGTPVRRHVIDNASATNLCLTFYAGSRQAEITWRVNGQEGGRNLGPHETCTVNLPAAEGRAFAIDRFKGRRHALRIASRGAPVLVRIGPVPILQPDAPEQPAKMQRSSLLEGRWPLRTGWSTLRERLILTPGRYAFELQAPADAGPFSLQIKDTLLPHPDHAIIRHLAWTNGQWQTAWDHHAAFLFTDISLLGPPTADTDHPWSWRIQPLEAAPFDGRQPVERSWTRQASFGGGRWTIGHIALPTSVPRGDSLVIEPVIEDTPTGREQLPDYALFLHVINADGKQVYARDIPLHHLSPADAETVLPHDLGALDLPPGAYELRIGVYHPRTRVRLQPTGLSGFEVRGDRVVIGSFTVTP